MAILVVAASFMRHVLLCAAIAGPVAPAQSTSATLSGVVVDEQRAIVENAAITLTSLETGGTRHVASDQKGTFRLSGLRPGRYELRAARDGFTPAVLTPLALASSEEARAEMVLSVAAVHQIVNVSASRLA